MHRDRPRVLDLVIEDARSQYDHLIEIAIVVLPELELILEHGSLGLGDAELLRLGQHRLPLGVRLLLVVHGRSVHGHRRRLIERALATEM